MWCAMFREINGLPPLQMLYRAMSTEHCPRGYSETKNTNNKPQYVRATKDIPGPKALPLLGNWFRFIPYIGEYGNANFMTQLRMLRDRYGNIVKLDGLMNQRSRILLFCPELCEQMYRSQGSLPIRISMESLHYYRTSRKRIHGEQNGLATSQGKLWQNFRLKVNPHMMQLKSTKTHVAHVYEVTSDFVERMRALRDPTTLQLPHDFKNELYKWALETISTIALGCRLGTLEPNLAADSEPQIMINCVQEMFDVMYRLERLPLWKIYNTRDLNKFFRVMDTIYLISNKHIDRAKTKFRERSADSTDLQDCSVLEKLMRIDEHTARLMALDMLIGGIDTTGNASSAMLYYLANNMEKQEKLREEVMSLLTDKTSPVTYDILSRTTYAKACIKESMRLFPIVAGIQRTMQKDISVGGYKVPKGFDVLACHALISMDSTQFPRPEEYIPERWLRDNTKLQAMKKAHPFAYMPFGHGVRTCIGRRFAEMELETLLLTVIRNFRIEWHYGPLEYKSQIVNTPTSPMRFKIIDL